VQTLRQLLISLVLLAALSGGAEAPPHTRVALDHSRWLINGRLTNPGSAAEGLLMNGRDDFPPPESQGGWRRLTAPEEIRAVGGMDPARLDGLRDWLLKSDDRDFAAIVIGHGYIVLQVERGNSAVTDSRRVASVSKAVCATVLAIASEWSQQGRSRWRRGLAATGARSRSHRLRVERGCPSLPGTLDLVRAGQDVAQPGGGSGVAGRPGSGDQAGRELPDA
jgi:hypothetical protein